MPKAYQPQEYCTKFSTTRNIAPLTNKCQRGWSRKLEIPDASYKLTWEAKGDATLLSRKGKRPLLFLLFFGMALRLSKTLGRTPESWLAMQDNYDLWQAKQRGNLDEVEKLELLDL